MTTIPESMTKIAKELAALRPNEKAWPLPPRTRTKAFLLELLQALFPQLVLSTQPAYSGPAAELTRLSMELEEILAPLARRLERPLDSVSREFFEKLPGIYKLMLGDAEAIFKGDPAAETIDEVILAYPGFLAIAVYRIAHQLYELKVPILPRFLSELAHQMTGVDIHPGATIGRNFFIDHATGVVIGETCLIGENVKLYQGVTLGAKSVDKSFSGKKRHPTIEDNVIIYSNATILGGDTTVGHDSVIGGNVWLTSSVPPHSTVYQTADAHVKNGKSVEGIRV